MKIRLIFLYFMLSGCASMPEPVKTLAESPNTFAACRAMDTLTTAYALRHGFVEANPIMRGILTGAGWPLFIALQIGMTLAMYRSELSPGIQTAANAVSCAPVGSNAALLTTN